MLKKVAKRFELLRRDLGLPLNAGKLNGLLVCLTMCVRKIDLLGFWICCRSSRER